MTTYYVDPLNGNNSNSGLSWALAKKGTTSIGSSGDTVLVAKSPDPVNIGLATFIPGTKTGHRTHFGFELKALFGPYGNCVNTAPTVTRNTALASATSSDLTTSGSAGSRLIAARFRSPGSAGAGVYSYLGAIATPSNYSNQSYTLPIDVKYIAIRLSAVRGLDVSSLAIGLNCTNTADATGSVGTSTQSITLNSTSTVSRSIVLGSQLGMSAPSEVSGTASDVIFFDVTGLFQPTALLNNICLFSNNATTTVFHISGIYLVKQQLSVPDDNYPAAFPAFLTPLVAAGSNGRCDTAAQMATTAYNRLNAVIALTRDKDHNDYVASYSLLPVVPVFYQIDSFGITDISGTTNTFAMDSVITVNLKQNYAGSSGFLGNVCPGKARIAQTYHWGFPTSAPFVQSPLVGGGATIWTGGVNTATSEVDGTTRFSCYNPVAGGGFERFAPSLTNVSFLKGFSVFNFNAALGPENASGSTLIFDDISSNAKPYDKTTYGSPAAQTIIHYNGLENTTNTPTGGASATVTLTQGFSMSDAKETTAVSGKLTSDVSMVRISSAISTASSFLVGSIYSAISMSLSSFSTLTLDYLRTRPGAFASTMSSSTPFTSARNRGYAFSPTETSTVSTDVVSSKMVSFVLTGVSAVSRTIDAVRGVEFASTDTVASPFDLLMDKTVPWTVSGVSAVLMSYVPIIPMTWASAETSAILQDINRDRGYSFASTTAQAVTTGPADVARGIAVPVALTAAVAFAPIRRAKNVLMTSLTSSSITAQLAVNRRMAPVVNATTSVVNSFVRSRPVSFTLSQLSSVASRIGYERIFSWASTNSQVVTSSFTRVKQMAMTVSQNTAISPFLRKAGRVAFSLSESSAVVFANAKLMAWASSATSALSSIGLMKERNTSFSASELAAATFGVGVNKAQSFSASQTSTVSAFLKRNRGFVFSIPMTLNMQAAFARAVGERWSAQQTPVISIVFNRNYSPDFNVISVVGNTMTIEYDKTMGFVIGELVTIDGELVINRPNETSWGASSGSNQAIGVGRGVRFTSTESAAVPITIGREVSLSLTSRSQSLTGVSANSNLLDRFYVSFESESTASGSDGSIIMAKSKVQSSDVLQVTNPLNNITVALPQTISITVREDD